MVRFGALKGTVSRLVAELLSMSIKTFKIVYTPCLLRYTCTLASMCTCTYVHVEQALSVFLLSELCAMLIELPLSVNFQSKSY